MTKSYGKIYQNKSNVSITPFDIYNLYPVGSIYMSVNSTNPSNYFGGTWEQIKDKFLLACGDTYANGATGGEATVTLKVEEMPRHNHKQTLSDNGSMSGKAGYDWSITNTSRDYDGSDLAQYSGGSQPHNNMPPYIAVYVWKRVA